MTRARGLTLVELLAALALLSAIAAASLAVTRTATRTAAAASASAAWDHAADSFLASIAADVAAGDFDPIGDRARGDPRVQIGEVAGATTLIIRTRDEQIGLCRRLYLFRAGQVEVLTECHNGSVTARARPAGATIALGDLSGAGCSIQGAQLIVHLASPAGQRRVAAFRLDEEKEP